jgi:hypothetical protein
MRSVWRQALKGQVVTRPSLSRDVAACRIQALHELAGVEKVTRMPDARTGHRTPDTRTPGHPRTGHRTSDTRRADTGRADAGHVPDAGRADAGQVDADGDADRATKARWTSGHLGHHDAAGTANRVLSAAAAHAALGNHDGSAVRPPASARDCRLQCHAAAGVTRRRPSGALAHCCPRIWFGSRVERDGGCHPLCRC